MARKKKIYNLLVRGKTARAISSMEKELDRGTDSGINSLILYELFISGKNEADAMAILEEVQPVVSGLPEEQQFDIYWHLGYLYYRNHQYKEAFLYLNKAYQLKKVPSLLAKVGQIYLEVGKLENAEQVFAHLTKHHPENEFYKAIRGYYYIKSGQDLKAEEILTGTLEKNPGQEYANYYMGYYFYTKKIYEPALEYFLKIEKNTDLKYKACYHTGLIREQMNDRGKAIEEYARGLKNISYENATTMEMRYNLALLYEQILDFRSSLEQWLHIYGHDPGYRDVAARLLSDDYKKIRRTSIMEFDALSPRHFLMYTGQLIELANLHPRGHRFLDKTGNILLFRCEAKKPGSPVSLLEAGTRLRHGENIPVIFCRLIPCKGNMLREILGDLTFPCKRGVLLSSGPISPLVQHDAQAAGFFVVSPSRLDRILRRHTLPGQDDQGEQAPPAKTPNDPIHKKD